MLAVGHSERYNPAVLVLKDRIVRGELGRIFQIEARRHGPFPARVRDVKKELLRAEIEAFAAAVRGEHSTIVSGQDGLVALELALALVRSGQEQQPIRLGQE